MSGTVASSGGREAKNMKYYKVSGTVAEFETTVTIPRSVIETNPGEIPRITAQMAQKASMFMDRRFIATALPSTTVLGYDGVALYSGSHPESGTNQDNDDTQAVTGIAAPANADHPTGPELENVLMLNLSTLKQFTDDQGTPVNEGVNSYYILVPTEFDYDYRNVLSPVNGSIAGLDVSTGRGLYRGMFEVLSSAFIAAQTTHYIFCKKPGSAAMALLKNKDWEFKTNIGTDSDLWNFNQTALFTAYARFEFIPWDWKVTYREVFS
jgi:hypothetical protein